MKVIIKTSILCITLLAGSYDKTGYALILNRAETPPVSKDVKDVGIQNSNPDGTQQSSNQETTNINEDDLNLLKIYEKKLPELQKIVGQYGNTKDSKSSDQIPLPPKEASEKNNANNPNIKTGKPKPQPKIIKPNVLSYHSNKKNNRTNKMVQVTDINKDKSIISVSIKEDPIHLGNIALANNQLEVALYFFQKAFKTDPSNKSALWGKALSHQLLSQYEDAANTYIESIRKGYKDSAIMNNLIISIAAMNIASGSAFANQLENSSLTVDGIFYSVAIMHIKVRDYHKGIYYMKSALAAHPDNINCLYYMAVLYDMINNTKQAIYYYKMLLKNIGNGNTNINGIDIDGVRKRIRLLS